MTFELCGLWNCRARNDEIPALVYELYGLTQDEIGIVEGAKDSG